MSSSFGGTRQITPVIMAGGIGIRLWPMSRRMFPKQFQSIHPNGETPFKAALNLANLAAQVGAGAAADNHLCVVTNSEHRFLAAEQGRESGLQCHIWTEPMRRSTAAVAALAVDLARSPEDLLLLMPADHYIGDQQAALSAFERAAELAEDGRLVVFGVPPTAPETGFGYIEVAKANGGCGREAIAFHEKPSQERAEAFLQAGNYLWNSGLFMVQAQVLEGELRRHAPEILDAVRDARKGAEFAANFHNLPEELWQAVPEQAFDRAVAEKTDRLSVVDFDVQWSDLGAFESLWQVGEADAAGNVSRGQVLAVDSKNNLMRTESPRSLVVMGIEDTVVVDSGDVVLVMPRAESQKMRYLVEQVEASGHKDMLDKHRRVYRPWGSFIDLDASPTHLCKRIIVNPGASLSLQRHEHRSEHWVVVRGEAEVVLGEETKKLQVNESIYVPCGMKHSLRNTGVEDLEVIEVQTGDKISEHDIIRYQDVYGRGNGNSDGNSDGGNSDGGKDGSQ